MNAFVGHSFDEKDKSLVDAILTFLKRSDVDWDDGVPPEKDNPSISEKIRKRIEANEVFIGIFTVDEEILQRDSRLGFARWIPRSPLAPRFTTSNWVIQESGYALGKGRKVIFLVERGIDKFPELQGDQERIYFTRGENNDISPSCRGVIFNDHRG